MIFSLALLASSDSCASFGTFVSFAFENGFGLLCFNRPFVSPAIENGVGALVSILADFGKWLPRRYLFHLVFDNRLGAFSLVIAVDRFTCSLVVLAFT